MRYVIVGIHKSKDSIIGYTALELNAEVLKLHPKIVYFNANVKYNEKNVEFTNADLENGKIKLVIGSPSRYPQYDEKGNPIVSRYNHNYKAVLIGRCAVRMSGGLCEGLIYMNRQLRVYSYTQLKELRELLLRNKGCIANGSIRKDTGRPEVTTWELTNKQREKSLFIYAKPILKDLKALNKDKLAAIQRSVDEAIERDRLGKKADTNKSLLEDTSGLLKDCIVDNGVLLKWNGDRVNPKIPEGITELGDNVFENNFNLKTVTLPGTLVKINDGSFKGCINLESVIIENNNVSTIGNNAFFGTRKLKYYSLSPKTVNIGDYAFAGSGLEKLDLIMPSLRDKGRFYKAGTGDISILEREEDGENEIIKDINVGYGAFAKNYNLTSVEFICDKPIHIGDRAFENCAELRTIKGDYYISYIGNSAFEGTTELVNIDLKSVFNPKLTYIGDRAFRSSNISGDIIIHPQVAYIGEMAFEAVALNNVTIYVDSLKVIKKFAFVWSGVRRVFIMLTSGNLRSKRLMIEESCFNGCVRLLSLTVSKQVQIIGGAALCEGCANLQSVNIGKMRVIPHSAFLDCINLCDFDFSGVKKIEDMAFSGTGILVVETDALEIGNYAFANTPLRVFRAPNATHIGENTFLGCSDLRRPMGYTGR